MPYAIGKAFSDEVLGSIDRARDRAAAHPATFGNRPITSLREAMIRADQDERENQTRRELGLAGIQADRDRYGAEIQRQRDADAGMAEYRQGMLGQQAENAQGLEDYRSGVLGERAQEGEDRAGRFAARGKYEDKVAAVREREVAAEESRAAAARDAAAVRASAENVRSVQGAQNLLLRARTAAAAPSPRTGKPDPERARTFIPLIHELEAFLTQQKRLPAGDVGALARQARAGIAADAGMGGVDDTGEEVDPLLDLGLDDHGDSEVRPPRFGD